MNKIKESNGKIIYTDGERYYVIELKYANSLTIVTPENCYFDCKQLKQAEKELNKK